MPGTTAALNLPGSALARATHSLSAPIFIDAGTATPRMVLEVRAIGPRAAGGCGGFSDWNGCRGNDPLGVQSSVWSSLAATNAWIATSPSAPGRFSITTGLPQRASSRSANSRAPISTPAPGPNGTMNFTGRCGQLWADVCAGARVAMKAGAARRAVARARRLVSVISRSSRGRARFVYLAELLLVVG